MDQRGTVNNKRVRVGTGEALTVPSENTSLLCTNSTHTPRASTDLLSSEHETVTPEILYDPTGRGRDPSRPNLSIAYDQPTSEQGLGDRLYTWWPGLSSGLGTLAGSLRHAASPAERTAYSADLPRHL